MKKLSKLFITVFAVLIAAFTLASCNKNEDKFSGTAKDLINRLILTENGTEVAADFTVPGTISAQDVTVDITWTSKNENYLKFVKNEDNTYTAQITKQDERVTAEFSAAVTYNNETASKDFKVRISRIIKPEEVVTNFYDAEKGAAVSVTGYITYLGQYSSSYKNFCLYMTDSNYLGGFYAYRVTTTQEIYDQLKVGSAVTVTGEKDIYSQGHQIGSGASIALADLPAYEAPEAYDATNDFILNEGNTMLYNTARYVTLKGMKVTKVNELNLEGSTSQTLVYLERAGRVANIATNGYLNEPSGSNSANYIAVNEVTKTLKVDDYVDVTGYLSNFNGTWQLIVLNAEDVVKTSAPTLSDAELVIEAMQKATGDIENAYSSNVEIALPATGSSNVALTYSVTGETAKIENGKLVLTPTADEKKVTLTVTGTLNGVSSSMTVEITTQLVKNDMEKTQAEIDALNPMSYEEYAAAQKDAQVVVQGYVTHAHYIRVFDENEWHVSIWLQDDNGGYYAYNATLYAKSETDAKAEVAKYLSAGSKIAVVGKVSPYNGWQEIGTGCTYYAITDAAKKTYDFADVTATLTANAADSATVKALQNQKVSIKNAVIKDLGKFNSEDYTITVTVGTNDYIVYFKDSYLEYTEDMFKDLAVGNVVDLEGIISVTKSNDKEVIQICPIAQDGIKKVGQGEETADTVLSAEVKALNEAAASYPSVIFNSSTTKEFSLYTSSDSRVAITWKVDGTSEYVSIADNKLSVTSLPEELTAVKYIATIVVTLSAEDTKTSEVEFSILLKSADATSFELYQSASNGTSLTVTATVVASGVNSSKGVAILQDEDGAYYVTASKVTADEWTAKFAPAHTVTVKGSKNLSNNMSQLVVASLDDVTLGAEATKVEALDVTDLVKAGLTPASHPELEGMYVVVKNATYDGTNLNVNDGYIQYYRDYSFPVPTVTLDKGGVYTVSGYLQRYSNKYELSPLFADDIILVTPAPVSDADAIMEYTGTSTTNMKKDVNNASSVGLDESVFNVTANACGNNNLPGLNKAGQIRLYSGDDADLGNGNEVIVSVTGKTISKIVISLIYSGKDATLSITGLADNVVVDGAKDITVEYTTAVTSFTIKNISSVKSTQAYISSIEIYFAE